MENHSLPGMNLQFTKEDFGNKLNHEDIVKGGWKNVGKQLISEAEAYEKGNFFLIFRFNTQICEIILKDPSKAPITITNPEFFRLYIKLKTLEDLQFIESLLIDTFE